MVLALLRSSPDTSVLPVLNFAISTFFTSSLWSLRDSGLPGLTPFPWNHRRTELRTSEVDLYDFVLLMLIYCSLEEAVTLRRSFYSWLEQTGGI